MPDIMVADSLLGRLDSHVEQFPDQSIYTYLHEDRSSQTLSYSQLATRVRSIASHLREQFQPGDRVVLLYPQGLEFICAFLACLAAGVIAVPAYPPRRNRKADRLNGILADCAPSALLTVGSVRTSFPTDLSHVPLFCSDEWETFDAPKWDADRIRPESIAFLQYTSGSTGIPRGVRITHANIACNEQQIEYGFGHIARKEGEPCSVMASWLPLFHDMGLIGGVLQPLYVGFPSVLMSPTSFAQEPVRWLRAISNYRCTTSGAPNFAYDHCVRSVTDEQKAGLDLSCLRVLYNGAEPVRSDTLDRFATAFASCGFRSRMFFPCYGMAEMTLLVSGGPPSEEPKRLWVDSVACEAGRIESVTPTHTAAKCIVGSGIPAHGVDVRIVNPQTRRIAEPGRIGEIWVKSDCVADGYWNRDVETRDAFRNHIAETNEGPFLATGDLGFMDAGELYITGRVKDLIIVRGRNIYPQDIEAAIIDAISFIEPNGCAAFAVTVNGAEQIAIVAEADRDLVRTARNATGENGIATDAKSELDALVSRVRQRVTDDFEVPLQSMVFVRPGTFPRTSSGKVQRHACRDGILADKLDVVHSWTAPRSEVRPVSRSVPENMLDPIASRQRADAMIVWLREYAERRLNSRMMDERRCVPPNVILDFGLHGLFGLQVSTTEGGAGLNTTDTLRVLEQLAAIDLTLCLMVGIHNGLGLRPLQHFSRNSETRNLLSMLAAGRQLAAFALTEPEAGSNPNAIRTTARRNGDEWIIRGEKRWIGLASWAGVITTFAKGFDADGNSIGMVALVVQADATGLRHGSESLTMGVRGIVQNTVHFDDVRVPDQFRLGEPGDGMLVAQDAMMFYRMGLAAISVGGMKRCAQLAARYADRRTIATGLLINNPVAQTRLGDIIAAANSTDSLVKHLAGWLDAGRKVPVEAYIACKTTGPELLGQAADSLMQLLGGRGYEETSLVPQLYRDARLLRIFEGPTETLNSFLGSNVLHRGEAIRQLLVDGFGQPELASEFQRAVDRLSESMGNGSSSRIANPVGEMASAAILAAAARKHIASSSFGSETARWASERFTRSCDLAVANASRPLLSSPELVDQISEFATSIGTIEQYLPGEDHRLDPLLRRDARSTDSPEPTIVTPEPIQAESKPVTRSISGTLRSIIVKWLRNEVDPQMTDVDEDTPFTSLGLDSVGAAVVALEIEKAVGKRLSADILYEYQTIRQLANFLGAHRTPVRDVTPGSTPAIIGEPSAPDGHTSHSKSDLIDGYSERIAFIQRMKDRGQYHYETVFDQLDGSHVVAAGQRLLMFSSYSYLGLIGHPEINQAVHRASESFGAGSHGARMIAGTTPIHRELEAELATFTGSEAAVVYNTGYVTNLATIAALVGKGDVIIGDEYNHASIADGGKFSGAEVVTFRHNDMADLKRRLEACGDRTKLVVVDAVFSMEGDIAPLPDIVALCDQYRAMLMVDEAHSLGVLGATGKGILEHFNLPPNAIDVKMGTLSKSLGSSGGYIAGKLKLIDYLKHTARGFLFSGAMSAPQTAAALTGLRILQREPERVSRLQKHTRRLIAELREVGFRLTDTVTPIVPVLCGTEEHTLEMIAGCRERGLFAIPIFYPAVPMNAPRIRLCVTSAHSEADIDTAIGILSEVGREVGLIRGSK